MIAHQGWTLDREGDGAVKGVLVPFAYKRD